MSISANRKFRIGVVVSNKMSKSISVNIERLLEHPLYHKVLKKRKRVLAHDERNECRVGDRVRISETRPLSKLKRWKVDEILERAE
ncbi:MAG: 30S ribosomal protein S17 [Candidatus Poribacteria bacterium]